MTEQIKDSGQRYSRLSSQLLSEVETRQDRRLRAVLRKYARTAKPQHHWDSILDEFRDELGEGRSGTA